MHHVPMSPGGDALDVERVEYFRAVADYAEMVSRGADLRFLVGGSDYALAFELAQLVPALSGSAPVLTVPELHDLAERLASDDPRSVRVLLVHELAKHCLSQDVIRCVAKYHDEEMAQFWLVQIAS